MRCSSATTWATRRWWPISPTRCRSRAGLRPSIETLLHGFLDAQAVIHTHADAIVSLTNNARAADVLAGRVRQGRDRARLPPAGFRISREVADAIGRNPQARAILLEKHGTITLGRDA